jgi:hypothetical protein
MRNVLFFVLFLCLIMSFCKCKCMCIWCTGIHCIFKGVWNTSIDLLCRNRWAIGMTEIKTIQSEIETIFTNWYIHWPVTLDHSIIYNLGRLVLQCFADKNHKYEYFRVDYLFYVIAMIISIFVQKFE